MDQDQNQASTKVRHKTMCPKCHCTQDLPDDLQLCRCACHPANDDLTNCLADKDREISAWIAACNYTSRRSTDIQRRANFWRQRYQKEIMKSNISLTFAITWFLAFMVMVLKDIVRRLW